MIKNLKKRISVLILAVSVMSVSLISPVYASDNYSSDKIQEQENTISEVGDNTVIVNSKDGVERLTVKEDTKTRKVTIYNTTTGEEEYLILHKEDGSMYSSITNKTISSDEQVPIVAPRSVTSYSTVYISWAQLKNTIGTTATVGGVLGLILTKVPGAQVPGGIIETISTIVGGGTLLIPNDFRQGLKFKVKTVKYYRTRLGKRRVWKRSKSITSVSRYQEDIYGYNIRDNISTCDYFDGVNI